MKLSEAIKLGSMLRPKVTSKFISEEGSCAMGAAYEAVYGYDCLTHNTGISTPNLFSSFPILNEFMDYPKELNYKYIKCQLTSIIVHLNDTIGWSREKIADWIEKEVEPKFPQYCIDNAPIEKSCNNLVDKA